jgi:hypothetical protein
MAVRSWMWAFIRTFVKEMEATVKQFLLAYSNAIMPGGGTEDRLPVLSIEHSGGRFWIRTRDPSLIRTVL